MSATITVAVAAHVLVQRVGPRPGAMHAAVPSPGIGLTWQTACGERLIDGPRGTITPISNATAWQLINDNDARLCRRCARTGDAVDQ